MELGPETSERLNRWLSPSTWYTMHELDMNRFYQFVDAYSREHGSIIDESALGAEVIRCIVDLHKDDGAHSIEEVRDNLQEIVSERISLAHQILGFLRETAR